MYCLISCFVLKYLAMRRMGTRVVYSQTTPQCHDVDGAVALSAMPAQSFVYAFQSCVCGIATAQYGKHYIRMYGKKVYFPAQWSRKLLQKRSK